MSTLFADPGLEISVEGAQRFLSFQRWLSLIFASSPYVNADQTYNRNPNRENSLDIHLEATKAALIKFCILYLPESNVNLNMDAAWNADPELCASLCIAIA